MSDWNSRDIKKKECYYESGTIAARGEAFLREVAPLRKYREVAVTPERAALLVLDMQDYFLEPDSHAFVPSSAAIIPRLAALQDIFITRSRPVIQTRQCNNDQNAGQMAQWWREVMVETNPLNGVTPRLARREVDIVKKSQYDAFYTTNLEARLREAGITQVVVGGVMTHLCCETTARSAFMRGFAVYFLIDGTASYNSLYHLGSLRALAHGFAVPVLCDEVSAAMGVPMQLL